MNDKPLSFLLYGMKKGDNPQCSPKGGMICEPICEVHFYLQVPFILAPPIGKANDEKKYRRDDVQ